MSDATETLVDLFERNRQFAESVSPSPLRDHDPALVSVSCCDARVSQDRIFGTEPGDHFTVAKIGNAVTERDADGEQILAGSVLYPLEKTSPECAIVVGHTDCGAVTAAWQQVAQGAAPESAPLQNELDLLLPIVRSGLERIETDGLDRDEQITRLVEYNVDRQVGALLEWNPDVPIVGVVCDLHGFYPGDPAQCHLTNLDGETETDRLPDALESYSYRHLPG